MRRSPTIFSACVPSDHTTTSRNSTPGPYSGKFACKRGHFSTTAGRVTLSSWDAPLLCKQTLNMSSFSLKKNIFWSIDPQRSQLRSWKTVRFSKQILSVDKHPSMFSKSNRGYRIHYPSNIFRSARTFEIGEYSVT